MKKTFLISIVSAVLLFMSGCAIHNGYTVGSVALSSNNFTTVKKAAQGKAEATYFLGFGGLMREAIVAEAKEDLALKNQLKDNQQLANLSVDYKNSFYVLVTKTKVTVTADIIEFK